MEDAPEIGERRALRDGRRRSSGSYKESRRDSPRRSRRRSRDSSSSSDSDGYDSDGYDRRDDLEDGERLLHDGETISPQCFRAMPARPPARHHATIIAAAARMLCWPTGPLMPTACRAATCWDKATRTYYVITNKRITRYMHTCVCCCVHVENVYMVRCRPQPLLLCSLRVECLSAGVCQNSAVLTYRRRPAATVGDNRHRI
jgi:hypothetical protein